MFFQPVEEAGILDADIKQEVLLMSRKDPKTAGFNYPIIPSRIPIEKIPYYYSASSRLGTNSFVIGGGLEFESETVFYSLDLVYVVQGYLNYWELYPIPLLKQARHCQKLLIVGERLIVLGGISKTKASSDLKFLNNCESLLIPQLERKIKEQDYPLVSYDAKWNSIAPMNVKRAQFEGFVHDSKVYVYGGYSGPQAQENSIERYDPNTNNWELIKDVKIGDKIPSPNSLFLAETLCLKGTKNDEFYIFGGTNGKERSKSVYVYNPKENSINEVCQLAQARSSPHGFADGDNFYVLGGDSESLSFEKISIQDGKATTEKIVPDFEESIDAANFEGIQGLFLGIHKPEINQEPENNQDQVSENNQVDQVPKNNQDKETK